MTKYSSPSGLPGVVEGQDVGVLQARDDPDLAGEAVPADRGRRLGAEHLDGDLPPVLVVVGHVHGRHAPAPDLAVERVAARERRR
jgi:hypothetical protein